MVAVDTLAFLGYQTDVARNGPEALQLATTKHYQAILMDCEMPKMDGLQATRELRRREGHDEHIPVIAMTAGARAEDHAHCLDAGMDGFVSKPIDLDDLRAALDHWIVTKPTKPSE
jgi:CheY-like chemotaxis protein